MRRTQDNNIWERSNKTGEETGCMEDGWENKIVLQRQRKVGGLRRIRRDEKQRQGDGRWSSELTGLKEVRYLARWSSTSSSKPPSASMEPWPQSEVLVTTWQRSGAVTAWMWPQPNRKLKVRLCTPSVSDIDFYTEDSLQNKTEQVKCDENVGIIKHCVLYTELKNYIDVAEIKKKKL